MAAPAEGDTVAVVGDNRKLLLFPLDEVPEMARGRGVILQRYHQGGLADARVITKAEGLSWKSGDRTRTETDLAPGRAPAPAAAALRRGDSQPIIAFPEGIA